MVPTSGEICGDRCYILRVLCACGTLALSTSLPAPTPTVALPTVALPRADTHENTKKSSAVGPRRSTNTIQIALQLRDGDTLTVYEPRVELVHLLE